jgi:hypothetical protein
MVKEDKIPRRAYDLIDYLDRETQLPKLPTTPVGFSLMGDETNRLSLAFSAGMRATVDFLLQWRDEEIADGDARRAAERPDPATLDVDMAPASPKYPDMYDGSGGLREPLSPRGVSLVVDKG